MANNRTFTRIGGLRPGRSAFDLSYNVKMTADMGILYPIMCDEVIPGDYFKVGNTAVVRFQPLVAPMLQEVNIYFHYFFVPYRILWSDWENYITGGVNGPQDAESEAVLYASVPRWQPNDDSAGSTDDNAGKGSLWDYFGFPIMSAAKNPAVLPLDFPRRAYNMIWNEYYRDENLMSEVEFNLDPRDDPSAVSQSLLRRSWAKDYFTSATPWQQRGLSPALPVYSTLDQEISDLIPVNVYDRSNKVWRTESKTDGTAYNASTAKDYYLQFGSEDSLRSGIHNFTAANVSTYDSSLSTINMSGSALKASFYIKGSDVGHVQTGDLVSTSFNIADLRLAFQIQKWMERNARAGVRYTEFLRAHYGVAPRDERLQRPEYIGGSKQPVVISEVLQTSKTDGTQPLGQQGGKAMSVASQYCGKYHATEFGLILGIMSVMPVASYSQGIDRQWIKETRYDFYSPEFANLSEQAILNGELYVPSDGSQNSDDFNTVFGFQGRYDELRVKRDKCVSWMRPSADSSDVNFSYWHLSRFFSEQPLLNESFLECNPRKDVFAVQDEPCMILNVRNHIKAVRPIPIQSEPGLIDHH